MSKVFSIIVPCYKVEKYLKKCIDSVLTQNFDEYELILVDDGSPDSCPEIIDEYKEKDKHVVAIHKQNGGLVSARNEGLFNASGDYVLYLDGDDWIREGTLRHIYESAIKNNNPDMIITNMAKVFEDNTFNIECYVSEGYYDKQQLERNIYPYMMYDSRKSFYHGLIFPSSGGKIIKTNLLKKHYCKNEKIRMGEDNAFIYECAYYANSIYFSDWHYYMYNQISEGSMVRNYDKTRFDNNDLLINYIETNLHGLSDSIDFQINAFKAYWLIMAIFHEVKSHRNIIQSRKHIKNKIETYKFVNKIDFSKLPRFARYYLTLIKYRMYYIALIGAVVINKKRMKKEINR